MNKDILKFLSKTVTLVLLIFFSTEFIHRTIVKLDEDTALVASLIDKHTYASSISNPKIILIGGSGVMYDYNSKLLSEYFKKPVVNFGLLAPLGIKFILSDAEKYINKNDTVILSFEYSDNSCEGDLETQLELIDYLPENKDFVSLFDNNIYQIFLGELGHKIKTIQKIPTLFTKPTVEDPYSIYFRKGFTPEGDIISHINNYTHEININEAQSDFEFKNQIDCMNHFIDLIEKRGAKVFFVHPVVAQGYYNKALDSITKADSLLKKDLHAPILTTPKLCQYPNSSFFDSVFHLKADARDIHTHKVIEALFSFSK